MLGRILQVMLIPPNLWPLPQKERGQGRRESWGEEDGVKGKSKRANAQERERT